MVVVKTLVPPLPWAGKWIGQRSTPQFLIQRAHDQLQFPPWTGWQEMKNLLYGIPCRCRVVEVPPGARTGGALEIQIGARLGQEPAVQAHSALCPEVEVGALGFQTMDESGRPGRQAPDTPDGRCDGSPLGRTECAWPSTRHEPFEE